MKPGFYKKASFSVAGVLMIPVLCGTLYSALVHVAGSGFSGKQGWLFLAGAALYLGIHAFFYKPITAHVFGHELTHAIWTWIFGGRVKSFKATEGGGHVVVTKSNFLTRLAPYFFPLYSALASVVYGIFYLTTGHHRYFGFFSVILGFSVGFHVMMTAYSLKVKQSDLTPTGWLFSMVLILLINIGVLMLLISFFFKDISFAGFLSDALVYTFRLVSGIGKLVKT